MEGEPERPRERARNMQSVILSLRDESVPLILRSGYKTTLRIIRAGDIGQLKKYNLYIGCWSCFFCEISPEAEFEDLFKREIDYKTFRMAARRAKRTFAFAEATDGTVLGAGQKTNGNYNGHMTYLMNESPVRAVYVADRSCKEELAPAFRLVLDLPEGYKFCDKTPAGNRYGNCWNVINFSRVQTNAEI